MAKTVHTIHSLPADAPWAGEAPSDAPPSWSARSVDRMLAIQRPLVLAHIRSLRLRHPHATPTDLVRMLERRYLVAVTGGGAAVGASAVIPGIGTGASLALAGVETAGFVEATALFAQSVAEVHGIPVSDPDRARALVLTLMMGKEGVGLVGQLTRQATGKGATRSAYWGELVTKTLPRAAVGPLTDQLKKVFLKRLAAAGGASVIGKALPFGVGAVVGGTGNHLLGRRVVASARLAFGTAPALLPAELEPTPGTMRIEQRVLGAGRYVAGAALGAAGAAVGGVSAAAGKLRRRARTKGDDPDASEPSPSADTDT